MLREVEFRHGAVLARLVRGFGSAVEIESVAEMRSAYRVGSKVAMYVKFSTNRMSPWQFSFSDEHQAEVAALGIEGCEVFVVLACGEDGIVCLDSREFKQLLDDDVRTMEWIRAARSPRQKYLVTGSDGRRGLKIGDNEFPSKLFAALA